METLYDAYLKVFNKKSKWKYYQRLNISGIPWETKDSAFSFINQYYSAGDKNEVFDSDFKNTHNRCQHSVSVFFLGILLSEIVLDKVKKDSMKPDFRYLWFISSLYHDYSYLIEEDKKKYPPENLLTLESIYKRFEVKYKVLNEEKLSIFDKGIIESYYDYRIKKCQMVDHGIIGGILLYDRLRKNYDLAYRKQLESDPITFQEHFMYNNLLWSSCQFEYFAEIAETIIAHNIWFCTKQEDKEKYIESNLESLIIGNDSKKKHQVKKSPFLFLLILADSLEPLKIKDFNAHETRHVLKNIFIELSKKKIVIEVNKDVLEYNSWFKNIKDLETWMQVKIEVSDNKLTIEF